MTMQHVPPGNPGLLGSLLMLPPKARILTGVVMAVLGAGLAMALWGRGVIAGATLFLMVAGFFLSWSGVSSARREARQKAQLQSILARKEEILNDMVHLKRSGGNPVRYLNEQAIQDPELRSALLEEMKGRLSAGK